MLFPSTHQPAGWDIIHTDTSLIFDGPNIPEPSPAPLRAAGKEWQPGTRFIFLGGMKTSAAFEWLDFTKAAPIEYLGQITTEASDTPLAVFRQPGFVKDGQPVLFGWHADGELLFWGTSYHSLRMIEMDRATVAGEEIPRHVRRNRNGNRARSNWPEWHECLECWHLERFSRANPEACQCSKCHSPNLTFHQSRSRATRATFDELERRHGHAATDEQPSRRQSTPEKSLIAALDVAGFIMHGPDVPKQPDPYLMKKRRPKFSKSDRAKIAKIAKDYAVDIHEAARMYVQRGF